MIQPKLYHCSMAFCRSKDRVVGRAIARTASWGDRAYDAEHIRHAFRARHNPAPARNA